MSSLFTPRPATAAAPATGDDRRPRYSVLRPQPGLRNAYARLVLITHESQWTAENGADEGALAFTTEWLTWQRCLRRGIPCVHFETFATPWPEDLLGDPDRLYHRAASWMLLDGADATLFRGVSLGAPFTKELAQIVHGFGLVWHALDRACRAFSPAEIVLVDVQASFRVFDDEIKRFLSRGIAERHGLVYRDRLSPPHPSDAVFQSLVAYPDPPEDRWRLFLRDVAAYAVDILSRLRRLGRGRPPAVFVWVSLLTLRGLLSGRRPEGFETVVLADFIPKSPRFILDCWKRGITLLRLPRARLWREEKKYVDSIVARLSARWTEAAHPIEQALRSAIVHRVFAARRLHQMAVLVKRYERLLSRRDFRRIVVADVNNAMSQIPATLAHARNIPVDEMQNGLYLTNAPTPSRIGDGCVPRIVSRQLCWGDVGRRWLKDGISSTADGVVIGYPGLHTVAALCGRDANPPISSSARRRALVLPVYGYFSDPRALQSNIDAYLVDIVAILREQGFTDITLKLHPSVDNPVHYEALNEEFALGCRIRRSETLAALAARADIVVGPAASGAFLETLAVGKPYYPVCPHPTSIDPRYLGSSPVVRVPEDLRDLLARDVVPDRDAILREFCAVGIVPDPCAAFWRALAPESAAQC